MRAVRPALRLGPEPTTYALLLILLAGCGGDGPTGPEPDAPLFSDREVDAYVAVALPTPAGKSPGVVRKWPPDAAVVLRVRGRPSPADRAEIQDVVADLNDLYGAPRLEVRPSGPAQVPVHFVPEAAFDTLSENYAPPNFGWFDIFWNARFELVRGRVLVDVATVDQRTRDHLLREELTQVLGLPADVRGLGPTIFHADFSVAPRAYSSLDSAILRIHARPEVRPGMDEGDVREALDRLRH